MNSFETSATVEDQGRVEVTGLPFAPGTQVHVMISAEPGQSEMPAPSAEDGRALAEARARMQELFHTVKGFRMAPKIPREELYDRERLR